MDIFVFIVLTVLGIVLSAGVLFIKGGPGIVGVCGAAFPLICGTPVALFVFMNPAFKRKLTGMRRSALSALVPILFASMWLGLLMYDQNPKVVFKRLLSDPIPQGISNIRSYDDSGGFDVEYGLAFETTPEAIDDLITKNGFELDTDEWHLNRYDTLFEYFPEVNQNQQWLYYSKEDKEHEAEWFLWVNSDKNVALLQFIGY